MIADMPREAKVGGGVWHEYTLLFKKKKKKTLTSVRDQEFGGPPLHSGKHEQCKQLVQSALKHDGSVTLGI